MRFKYVGTKEENFPQENQHGKKKCFENNERKEEMVKGQGHNLTVSIFPLTLSCP